MNSLPSISEAGRRRVALGVLALSVFVLIQASTQGEDSTIVSPSSEDFFRLTQGGSSPASGNPHGPITLSCESCHTAEGWIPLREDIDFDHNRDTRFRLTGRHTVAECRSCHLDLIFTEPRLIGETCGTCHVDVHQGNLGPDCSTCHGTVDFALVDIETVHARTAFPLTGMHRGISCAACHFDSPDGRFAPVESDCLSCHAQDFARAIPDHSGFPTTCQSCHGTVAWQGARFDHDHLFPIYSGKHAGEWTSCQSCHLQPASFDSFSCTHCHAHRRSEMDDEHEDVPGYIYESSACLNCHPTGEE